jgi:hypothetical protein
MSKINGDLDVNGTLSSTGMSLPANTVSNSQVTATAAIAVTKTDHLIVIGHNFEIEADTAPGTSTTYTFTVYAASGPARIRIFKATLLDYGSQSNSHDFTFDLQKAPKGSDALTTILSSVITLDSDNTDNTPSEATVIDTAIVEGDSLTIELVTPGTITGAHGAFAWIELSEGAN